MQLSIAMEGITAAVEVGAFFCSVERNLGGVFQGGVFSLTSITAVTTYVFVFNLFCVVMAGFDTAMRSVRRNISIAMFFRRSTASTRVHSVKRGVGGHTRIDGGRCISTSRT